MTNYLYDQARDVFRTSKATFIPTALYGNGPAALTTVTPTSDKSKKNGVPCTKVRLLGR
jgi:hypothetical protein